MATQAGTGASSGAPVGGTAGTADRGGAGAGGGAGTSGGAPGGLGGMSASAGANSAGANSAGANSAGASGASGAAGAGGFVYSGPGCIVPVRENDEPALLSQTGCVDPADATKAAASLVPYDVNSPLWSDGAAKERYLSLPAGAKIHVKDCSAEPDACKSVDDGGTAEDEGHWDLPVGTTLVKVFLLGGARIETRLFMRVSDTQWRGYSYEWNEAGTDATLLPDQKDKVVGAQTWHYPSRSQCLACHTEGAGRSLGPTTAQMNRDYAYAGGAMNQLDEFEALGAFDHAPARIAPYPSPSGDGDLDARARSYLHANCAICHRPGATVSDMDLRFEAAFSDMALCNQVITANEDDLTLPRLRLVPGDPTNSSLSYRMHATTGQRMPKLGSNVVDADGTALIDQWITSITSCP
jgi:uncharacterized repeat protein (TIGR03806 family)